MPKICESVGVSGVVGIVGWREKRKTDWEGYQQADGDACGDGDGCLLVVLRGEDFGVLHGAVGCRGD